ncbi:MAG: type 4a pilus biogenesis protein PilO [Candidatus Altimarinota bacterium]
MNNKSNKNSIISLVLMLALLAVGLFWAKPTWDEAAGIRTALESRQTELDALQTQLNELQSSQTNLEGGSEVANNSLLTAIPENFEQDKLIEQIVGIVSRYQLNLNSISFSIPLGSTDNVKRAGVNVSLTGEKRDLLAFLKGIESNPRKLYVKSVTVQVGQSEETDLVNFSISMDTFFQAGI